MSPPFKKALLVLFTIGIVILLIDKGFMEWRDLCFLGANILVALGLFPQVKKGFVQRKEYIDLETSCRITIAMFLFLVPVFSLRYYYSGIVMIFNTIMWILLLYQSKSKKFEKA